MNFFLVTSDARLRLRSDRSQRRVWNSRVINQNFTWPSRVIPRESFYWQILLPVQIYRWKFWKQIIDEHIREICGQCCVFTRKPAPRPGSSIDLRTQKFFQSKWYHRKNMLNEADPCKRYKVQDYNKFKTPRDTSIIHQQNIYLGHLN